MPMKTFKIIVYPGGWIFVVRSSGPPRLHLPRAGPRRKLLKNIKEAIELYLDSPQHENGPIRMVEVQEVAVEILTCITIERRRGVGSFNPPIHRKAFEKFELRSGSNHKNRRIFMPEDLEGLKGFQSCGLPGEPYCRHRFLLCATC